MRELEFMRKVWTSSKIVDGIDICDKLINLLTGWLYRWTIQIVAG